jgi:hypothetical protein
MSTQRNAKKPVTVELSTDELTLINNALNEVVNGIHFDDGEFMTRLGVARAKANALLAKVGKLLAKK